MMELPHLRVYLGRLLDAAIAATDDPKLKTALTVVSRNLVEMPEVASSDALPGFSHQLESLATTVEVVLLQIEPNAANPRTLAGSIRHFQQVRTRVEHRKWRASWVHLAGPGNKTAARKAWETGPQLLESNLRTILALYAFRTATADEQSGSIFALIAAQEIAHRTVDKVVAGAVVGLGG